MNWILYLVPKKKLSRLVGFGVHLQLPKPLRTAAIHWFAKRYSINLSEAEYPISHYASIGDFFVRKLKPGIRPIGSAPFVHPADSLLTQSGTLKQGLLIQAKGKFYQLKDFLAPISSDPYLHGEFATYYLCPRDYHRVHSPVEGVITRVAHVPGELWPVNEWSTSRIDNLFSINERVVVEIQTKNGAVAVVFVGATNVGQVSLSFWPEFRGLSLPKTQSWSKDFAQPLEIQKGQELGAFHMGSTVVVCLSPGAVPAGWQNLPLGRQVLVGASFEEGK